MFYWCLTERDCLAVPVLQAQMDASVWIAPDARKMGARVFRGVDILDPWRCELETIWIFGGEAKLIEYLLEQRNCPLEWNESIRSPYARRH